MQRTPFSSLLALGLGLSLAACAPEPTDDLFADGDGDGGAGAAGGGTSVVGTGVTTSVTSTGPTTTTGTGATTSSTSTTSSTGTGSFCGDGTVDFGEVCDGADLGGLDCTDFGYVQGAGLTCALGCADVSTDGCNAVCNNGVAEPGEECDGDELGELDCTDFGFATPGTPDCSQQCAILEATCEGVCGNGMVEPDEECDGGDGCVNCTLVDPACPDAEAVSLGMGRLTRDGSTANGQNGFTSSAAPCAGAPGKSRMYAVTPSADGFLTAWLDRPSTAFDSVLYVRTDCEDDATTILCANSRDTNTVLAGGEVVSFLAEANTTYYVVVDGAAANASGDYRLVLDLSAGQNCQDPIPLPIWVGGSTVALGATNGQTASTGGTCGGGGQGTGADDVVYRVERETAGITNMQLTLPAALTDYDAILYARFDCSSTFEQNEFACDDSDSPTGGEQLSLAFQNNDVRYVWVDGFQGDEGDYGLVVTPTGN